MHQNAAAPRHKETKNRYFQYKKTTKGKKAWNGNTDARLKGLWGHATLMFLRFFTFFLLVFPSWCVFTRWSNATPPLQQNGQERMDNLEIQCRERGTFAHRNTSNLGKPRTEGSKPENETDRKSFIVLGKFSWHFSIDMFTFSSCLRHICTTIVSGKQPCLASGQNTPQTTKPKKRTIHPIPRTAAPYACFLWPHNTLHTTISKEIASAMHRIPRSAAACLPPWDSLEVCKCPMAAFSPSMWASSERKLARVVWDARCRRSRRGLGAALRGRRGIVFLRHFHARSFLGGKEV